MLWLGLPERPGRGYLRYDPARPETGGVDIGDGLFRHPALVVVGVEDGGAVAQAPVVAPRFGVVGSWIWKKNSSMRLKLVRAGS